MKELSKKANQHYSLSQRWSDMDAMGHVNNAVYLTYLEEARTKFLEEVLEWDWNRVGLIMARAVIDFKSPLHFEDQAEINIGLKKIGTKSFEFEYRIMKNSENIILIASTVIVVYDYKLQKSVEIPSDMRQKMEKIISVSE